MKPTIYFYNTLTRKKEEFVPIKKGQVKMYNCGPTVYDYAQIGNWRGFVFYDFLRRFLEYAGYKVTQVINLTDVGHLVSDDDIGQDKMLKALQREKKKTGKDLTIKDLADYYIKIFKDDYRKINILPATYMPRATDYAGKMIDFIKVLEKKGYTYVNKSAVYFDVSKFKDYTKLFPQALDEKVVGARSEVIVDPGKKHPADFRLWQLDQKDHPMQWDSPWGKGFPGWHIECSTMSKDLLGETIDIHTGGIDHIPVHHTNEIAQSEAANEKPLANYWMHNEFLRVDGGKMSKSKGNFYIIQDLIDKGYSALDLRYFYLTASYRSPLNFTWKALDSARQSRLNLKEFLQEGLNTAMQIALGYTFDQELSKEEVGKAEEIWSGWLKVKADLVDKKAQEVYMKALADDLNTPQALEGVWQVVKKMETVLKKGQFQEKNEELISLWATLIDFDRVLGLKLDQLKPIQVKLSANRFGKMSQLLSQRAAARQVKDWDKSDQLREKVEKEYKVRVKDNSWGQSVY